VKRRLFVMAMLAGLVTTPAFADGNVKCNAGPQQGWKPLADLKKKAWIEGWSVVKVQVDGDCYELYARTETGQAVEAFFHPVSLQKLIVYRRGKEIYRAPGFNPG
jgi:hypothetical protein